MYRRTKSVQWVTRIKETFSPCRSFSTIFLFDRYHTDDAQSTLERASLMHLTRTVCFYSHILQLYFHALSIDRLFEIDKTIERDDLEEENNFADYKSRLW